MYFLFEVNGLWSDPGSQQKATVFSEVTVYGVNLENLSKHERPKIR